MATTKVASSYQELISLSQKDKEALDIQYYTEDAEVELNSSITATKRALTTEKRKLENAKSAIPFKPAYCVELQETVDNYAKGLSYLEALKKELFPKTAL